MTCGASWRILAALAGMLVVYLASRRRYIARLPLISDIREGNSVPALSLKASSEKNTRDNHLPSIGYKLPSSALMRFDNSTES